MKNLMKLGTILNKNEQKEISGGRWNGCSLGISCHSNYIVYIDNNNGEPCAVFAGNGEYCLGTINNNQCCLN